MSERRKLRFGVRAEDGRRSRVWSVTTVAHGSDVYLTPGGAPSAFHFSLHSDDYWHMKMVHPIEPGSTDSHAPRMAPEEQIPFDVIPKPRPDRLTRAFLIAVSPGGLSVSAAPPRRKVGLLLDPWVVAARCGGLRSPT